MMDIDRLQKERALIGQMKPGTVFLDYLGNVMTKISHPEDDDHLCHAKYGSGTIACYSFTALGIVQPQGPCDKCGDILHVKRFPITGNAEAGTPTSNVFLCLDCMYHENIWRKERNRELPEGNEHTILTWQEGEEIE